MDWHEISECAIKYATIRPGSQISKIAIHLPTRSKVCGHTLEFRLLTKPTFDVFVRVELSRFREGPLSAGDASNDCAVVGVF